MSHRKRIHRPPLAIEQLVQDGPAVKIRDLVAMSGLSSPTIRSDIKAGLLRATKRGQSDRASYLIQRADARAWLKTLGFQAMVS